MSIDSRVHDISAPEYRKSKIQALERSEAGFIGVLVGALAATVVLWVWEVTTK